MKIAGAAIGGLVLLVVLLMGATAGLVGRLFGGGTAAASPAAVAGIPADYLALYTAAAATCPGLHWSVLAAVGKVETDHGRSTLPGVASGTNAAGAMGPMQFLAGTFGSVVAAHPPPADGASPPSPYNPSDAVFTAAAYLCDNGARDNRDLPGALWTYNHSAAYVNQVLDVANGYAATAPAAPGDAATAAIGFAMTHLGLPYVWGGNGPEAGDAGFDCSGLTQAAYAAAGVQLPRVAADQLAAGPAVSAGEVLQPGDLVFFANATEGVHHVALYLGDGQIIHAPQRGDVVRIANLADVAGYIGATRSAHRQSDPVPGRGPPR